MVSSEVVFVHVVEKMTRCRKLLGVSLSEPHTFELKGRFLCIIYIYIYIYI